jgi:hypothetical protein
MSQAGAYRLHGAITINPHLKRRAIMMKKIMLQNGTEISKMSSEEIIARVNESPRGSHRVVFVSDKKVASANAKAGITVTEKVEMDVLVGVNWKNTKACEAKGGPSENYKPWFHHDDRCRGLIVHNTNGTEYLQLDPMPSNYIYTQWYVNGRPVSKATALEFLTPGERNKIENPDKDRPEWMAIKLDNIYQI